MEIGEKKSLRGYDRPPWIFRGRALYQLHLVRADVARAVIPKEFRLVEAFGYTLGGFFLASYEDSPAGVFDELVVIAGTVWNPPTSCAWAAKVLVNSDEACKHGRKDVGLPSQVARFSKRLTPAQQQSPKRGNQFLSILGIGAPSAPNQMEVSVCEIDSLTAAEPCHINLVTSVAARGVDQWRGPSWSDRLQPQPPQILLPDRVQVAARDKYFLCETPSFRWIRAVSPVKVTKLSSNKGDIKEEREDLECRSCSSVESVARDLMDNEENLSLSVMLSKPILALEFTSLKMQVEAPAVISHCSETTLR